MSSEAADTVHEVADLPRERTQFKELLLQEHFKLAAAETGPPEGDTSYEQLVCVGYRPQFNRLDAVVQIKQPVGYSGGICTAGSQEYVTFFASTDNGATWTDLGLTAFTVWDVPGPKPQDFDVTIPVDLAATCCTTENLVLIRAILSWEVPPGGPDDPIVFGNGLDAHVQVAPLTLGTLQQLFECLHLPFEPKSVGEIASLDQIVEFGPAQELTPVQLHDLYKETNIPQHRYLLSEVTGLLADPVALGAASHQPHFKLVPGLAEVANLGDIIGIILDPQGDEYYEQLGCVGLNTVTDELIATIDVKQSSGYSGGLCTAGSQEYVAFWADWGGGFQYLGTSSVNVHDIASIPADGLQYSAYLSFPQALTKCQPCTDGPLIVTIRAVLSWGTPPSTTDPFAVPVWGGHEEATVLIPPGEPVTGGGPVLESIGSMPIPTISDATGLATGPALVPAIGIANACPFGAGLEFTGHVINPATGLFGGPGFQYRILVSTNGGVSSAPMLAPFEVVLLTLASMSTSTVTQTPDPNGWVDYLEVSGMVDVIGNILGTWTTSGDGQIWISMEAQQGGAQIGTGTPWKLVQLDNTAPAPVDIEITSGAGGCGDFYPGDELTGIWSAEDNENLAAVTVSFEPSMTGATLTQAQNPGGTLTSQTGTWSLQTAATSEPCGYVMIATARDNTIVGSGYIGWYAQAFKGFCLRPSQGS